MKIISAKVFLGQIDQIETWFCITDFVLHCSLKPEPFGRTIIEAFAYQKVIIASNLGGPSETIRDNLDGILFSPTNDKELEEKMILLSNKKEFAVKIAKAGHQKYLKNFTPEIHYQNIIAFFQEILNR